MAVNEKDMIAEFTEEIASAHGAHRLLASYQCGKCTAGCPLACVNETFSPKRLIRQAQLQLSHRQCVSKDILSTCSSPLISQFSLRI